MRWCTPVILGRLRKENPESEANLGHIARTCLKKRKSNKPPNVY
jgi:hypothetical protein